MEKELSQEALEKLEDQKRRAREYSEMVEAKLRKAEKRTWMIKDLDFLD